MRHSNAARRAAVGAVELARARVDELLEQGEARPLRELLVNVYLQGMVDGSLCEQLRVKSRGHYKRGSVGA